MAANKFATMLHRNTNKLTLILVYAVLEWVLIVLLLLNSLFSFLILKFADYFGLKRPCLWCSRIDHVFEPNKGSYLDLVCEDHASEIGKLGYCSNHRKLAESNRLCEDCSAPSRPSCGEVGDLPWVKQIWKVCENGEVGSVSECSCCGVSVCESKLYPPWRVFDFSHRDGSLVVEAGVDDESDRCSSGFVADDPAGDDDEPERGIGKDRGVQVGSDIDEGNSGIDEIGSGYGSGSKVDVVVEKEQDLIKLHDDEDEDGDLSFCIDDLSYNQAVNGDESTVDTSHEVMPQHLEFFIGHEDYRLIPVELIDSATEENQIQYICEEANRDVVLNFDVQEAGLIVEKSCTTEENEPLLAPIHESEEESELKDFESSELAENDRSLVPEEEDVAVVEKEEDKLIVTAEAIEVPSVEYSDVQEIAREMDADVHQVSKEKGEEDTEMPNDEMEADVSIGTEIPDHEPVDEFQAHEDPLYERIQEDPSTSPHGMMAADHDHGSKKVDQEEVEFKALSVETSPNPSLGQVSQSLELNDIEEDKVLDSPSSVQIEQELEFTTLSVETSSQPLLSQVSQSLELNDIEEDKVFDSPSSVKVEQEVEFTTFSVETSPHPLLSQVPQSLELNYIEEDKVLDAPNSVQEVEFKTLSVETSPNPLFSQLSRSFELNDIEEDKVLDAPSYVQVEQEVEFKALSVETSPNPLPSQVSRSFELNDIEEEKVPDTPSSVDSLHQFNRRLYSLERRESGTESLDGSVISDIEPGEMSIEKLSSALRAERKALNALYAELDEERSASAVAASQTMAMINRLQEEKAAMQMEALQYQRMMEEQSEYDQEALQLLNELMVKREREKQELEKELEAYRRKVQDYEAREKMLVLRRKEAGIRSMTSSVSCSNAEDSDGSVDLNREVKEDDTTHLSQQDGDNNDHNTPTDAVLYLEESLANFEEERMSILEELKVLEEKLFTMNSEEEDHFEDVKTFETGHDNGNGYNDENGVYVESNSVTNGHHKEMNGKHHQGTRTISKPKRLLPLFDAIELGVEDGALNVNEHGFDSASQHDSSDSIFELESKRPAIEEEVDHVYERLQALEADREFLKHCMSSLKKGDKGVYLLQEILQHLRDLRNVELRAARNMEDGVI